MITSDTLITFITSAQGSRSRLNTTRWDVPKLRDRVTLHQSQSLSLPDTSIFLYKGSRFSAYIPQKTRQNTLTHCIKQYLGQTKITTPKYQHAAVFLQAIE
ncbi:MAG TPA: hypothetical protein DCS91_03755 [Microcoleaceae bacterium UBA11344]|nr:hypothetical protein [Microcoleaceae cyanobacterium UBA11344]